MLNLPCSSAIHTWVASVDCEPVYLTNVISLIGQLAEKKKWMSDVVLVVDAMSFHVNLIDTVPFYTYIHIQVHILKT